jgi:adenylate kinase family enzyme
MHLQNIMASRLSSWNKYGMVVCMKKIVIIGSPGSGKSTLARKLGSSLNIKVVHLDRIFWQSGWKEKPRDTRIDIMQKIVREKQWIIEGTYLSSSEPRLDAADTIIFLDIPPFLCLQRIIKRHLRYHGPSRRDIPERSTDKLTLYRMFKVLVFPMQDRRTLKQKLLKNKSKQIFRLRSDKEVEDFLVKIKPHADEKRQSSKIPSAARNRQLP